MLDPLRGYQRNNAIHALRSLFGFAKKREWQREIQKMLQNDFKLEVESLISKDISYVTEEYVPARLADQDWLD